MSSFKRKVPSRQVALPPGTRSCPTSVSTILTSSGIPSLDDVLGSGMPLSCSLTVLAPDPQSAYGELVHKYFVAQGIANDHKVCIVHEDALSFAKECMWMPASCSNNPTPTLNDDDAVQSEEKIKIAWRYEQMKKFETTVTNLTADRFCNTFDLTCRIPTSVINEAHNAKRLVPLNLASNGDPMSLMDGLVKQIKQVLATTPSAEVVRLCIVALGSPEWGECCPQDILRFLYTLRRLLRQYSHSCACITLAPHLCTELWAGAGWLYKVGWATDATISISGFGADPALTSLFPSHHGLVQIHKLPAPHSILPTSDKYSTLRGLSSSAAAGIGTGENNLAFKCTRKSLILETMHLDLEGGVTERRTTPSSAVAGLDIGRVPTHVTHTAALARVAVELEETLVDTKPAVSRGDVSLQGAGIGVTQGKVKRVKKKVAFHSDKPDLYNF